MARKIILSMHVSLDGYVATPDGGMDWVRFDDELFRFVGEMTEEADTALYGRKTWEIMDNYWPTADQKPNAGEHDRQHAAWYRRVNKVVISDSMKGRELPRTRIFSGNIAEQVTQLKQEPGSNIMIFGSPGASQVLMENGLIDEYHLFVNPVALNKGIPLFKQKDRVNLKLTATKPYECGVAWLHFRQR
ncbi:dihydrofolate reductase family protein [Chitinophaga sp. GCM10012297]|uniref:Dihydrofolate reductase n=1 Tax=Chitinophaga chungangae TaxID=2821488 RepID=A0ABS3YAX4_9BACT|nr:dihydrofolate reductase family protein [Chitinophaga chungangae]MBO9151630.1 dihydrofolate reductase [Chitinophaga chungangae]